MAVNKDPKPQSTTKRLRRIKREGLRRAKGRESNSKSGDVDADLNKIRKGYAENVTNTDDKGKNKLAIRNKDKNAPQRDLKDVEDRDEYLDNSDSRANTSSIREKFRQAKRLVEKNQMNEEDIISGYSEGVSTQLGVTPQQMMKVMNKNTGQLEEHYVNPDSPRNQQNEFGEILKRTRDSGENEFYYKGDNYQIVPNETELTYQKPTFEQQMPVGMPPSIMGDVNPDEVMAKGGKMRNYKLYEEGGVLSNNEKAYSKYDSLNVFQRTNKFKLGGKIYEVR